MQLLVFLSPATREGLASVVQQLRQHGIRRFESPPAVVRRGATVGILAIPVGCLVIWQCKGPTSTHQSKNSFAQILSNKHSPPLIAIPTERLSPTLFTRSVIINTCVSVGLPRQTHLLFYSTSFLLSVAKSDPSLQGMLFATLNLFLLECAEKFLLWGLVKWFLAILIDKNLQHQIYSTKFIAPQALRHRLGGPRGSPPRN